MRKGGIKAKRTRMHCVGLCCPEGGVLTSFLFSFLSFFSFPFFFLYKQRSQETLGLGRAVEPPAPHPGCLTVAEVSLRRREYKLKLGERSEDKWMSSHRSDSLQPQRDASGHGNIS